jgi:hypothetical protein
MKIFAYVISFYILILNATPCIDVSYDNTLQKVELIKNITDNHQKETGHCSPFCLCNCCASPIIYQTFSVQYNYISLAQKFYSEYKSAFVSFNFPIIWEPPKII